MTTPHSRRQFLTTLAGLAVAPFVASRALAAAKTEPTLDITTIPLKSEVTYARSRSILVPSNRYLVEDWDSIKREGYHPGRNVYHRYHGDWDGTLKLETGCTNPAYV